MSRRTTVLILGAILLLALALRLVNLGERNLWYDEAFSILFARTGFDAMLYGTVTPVDGGAADIHPLLYYTLLNGWMRLFGEGVITVRLLSVVLGLAAVPVMFLLGRDLFDRRVGLAAALTTAIAPFHVQYSQEARMYSLLALVLLLATWAFVRGWRSGSWRWWLSFGVFAALGMYAQQLAAFYLVALGLAPLPARNRRAILGTALGAAVALVLYLPWLVQLPGQWSKVGAYYWVATPSAARFLLTLRTFFAGAVELAGPGALLALGLALLLTLFLGLQAALALRSRRRRDRHALAFTLWLAIAPSVLTWLVSQVRPVYLERALLPSALLLYLALAWLFTRGGLPRFLAVMLGVAGVALAVIGLQAVYTWDRFPNSAFRQAAAMIEREWQAGDRVLHQSKLSALPMMVYAPKLDQDYVGDRPGGPEDTLALPTRQVLGLHPLDCLQAAGGVPRLWLVTFDTLEAQSRGAGRDDVLAGLDWLRAHYAQADDRRLGDLKITLYTGPRASEAAQCPQ